MWRTADEKQGATQFYTRARDDSTRSATFYAPGREARSRLDGTARTACGFYSGVTSTLRTRSSPPLGFAIVWHGILARGWTLDLIQPDSVADLSISQAGKRIAIQQPDTLFVTQIALQS